MRIGGADDDSWGGGNQRRKERKEDGRGRKAARNSVQVVAHGFVLLLRSSIHLSTLLRLFLYPSPREPP